MDFVANEHSLLNIFYVKTFLSKAFHKQKMAYSLTRMTAIKMANIATFKDF